MQANLMNRRELLRGFGIGVAGLALVSCAPPPPPPPAATTASTPAATPAAPSAKPTPPPTPTALAAQPAPVATKPAATPKPLVKVVVAHPTRNIDVALPHLGKEKGYFREEGLDLDVQQVPSANAVKAMLTGEIHFIYVVGTALASIISGAPLKVIFIETRGPIAWLYGRPQYKAIDELRGKNIAIAAPGDTSQNLVRSVLGKIGWNPETDVNYVVVPGASETRLRALVSGAVDGAVLFSPDNVIADQQGLSRVLFFSDYQITLGPDGGSTTDQMIKDRPEVVRGFVRGAYKSLQFLKSNRAAAIPLLAPFMNLEPGQVSAIYDSAVGVKNDLGFESDEALQAMIDEQRRVSQVDAPVPVSQAFDLSFAKQAAQEIKASGWKPQ